MSAVEGPRPYGTFSRRRKLPASADTDGQTQRRLRILGTASLVVAATLLAYVQLAPTAARREAQAASLIAALPVEERVPEPQGKDAREKALASSANGSDKPANPPNIVYIMIDDMGYNDIGYQSTDLSEVTPTMDALASQGIKLTNYYSMYLCTPARASLMTGRYAFRYGMQYNVIQPAAPWGLPLTEKIMPEYFKGAGYSTHMVGKWHLGMYVDEYLPNRRGFDTFLGYLNDEEDYWNHQSYSEIEEGLKFFDFGYGDKDGYIDETTRTPRHGADYIGKYSTTVFTDRAVDVVWNHANGTAKDKPLFLYFASQAVHSPINPPSDDSFTAEQLATMDRIPTKRLIRRDFAAVLMYLDMSIKRLVTALEDSGLMNNTLIVVTSDNGGCIENGGNNYPLRGTKHSYWEGGNRVPAFVYSPALLPKESWGTEYAEIVHVTDWLPTFAGLAGLPLDSDVALDGVDQWAGMTVALVEGAPPPRNELIYNFDSYQSDSGLLKVPGKGAIRMGKWKLIIQEWCGGYYSFRPDDEYDEDTCPDLHTCWSCGVTCYSLMKYKPASYLFDLEADPIEQIDLTSTYPHVAGYLYQLWATATEGYEPTRCKATMAHAAENIWSHHDYWITPWWDIFENHNATDTPDKHGGFLTPAPTPAPSPAPVEAHIAMESLGVNR